MPNLKSSQRQIVAELLQPTDGELPTNAQKGPAIGGYWAQMSGGEVTAAVEKVYDGSGAASGLAGSTGVALT